MHVVDGEPPPGLFTVKAATSFLTCMAQAASLTSGFTWANRLLTGSSGSVGRRESFSACYFQLDEGSAVLEYVNAGFPPPFFYQAADAQLFSLAGTNHGLLSSEASGFEGRKVPVAKNDIILVVTNGFLEAKGQSKDLFGWHRAQQGLLDSVKGSASSICSALTEKFQNHLGTVQASSDWALMVLKKK